jgi:putative peptidoglycan lipid II flippase
VVVSSVVLVIDRNLASQVDDSAIGAMRFATTVVQFGLGLVAAAISLASLPSLSQHFTSGDTDAFKRTLSSGLRLVTVLVLPVAGLLLALAGPIVALLFGYGAFTRHDSELTELALRIYVIGLPFSAVDQILIFAFYARKNTVLPAAIGIAQFAVYLVIAFGTYKTWGLPGLVLAWSAQLAFHAILTGIFLLRAMKDSGGLRGYGIGSTALKTGAASLATAIISFGAWWLMTSSLGMQGESLVSKALLFGIPALLGGALYAGLVWRMRLPEVELILAKATNRLRRRSS